MKTALHIALPLLTLGLAACVGAPEPGDDDTDLSAATTIDDGAAAPAPVPRASASPR